VKLLLHIFSLLPALSLLASATATTATVGTLRLRNSFQVSTNGIDSQPGNSAMPWKTLAALNSQALPAGSTVSLGGGQRFYGQIVNFSDSVRVQSTDSGRPTIDAGTNVTGWALWQGDIWRAPLAASVIRPRAVFVNGIRCVRSRTGAGLPSGSVTNAAGYSTASSSSPGYLSSAYSVTNVEFICRAFWSESRTQVGSVSGNTIVMPGLAWTNLGAMIDPRSAQSEWTKLPVDIENVWEVFTNASTAGTFYHDRGSDFLYLVPPAGITPTSAEIIVPLLSVGVRISGVSGVILTNIVVEHVSSDQVFDTQGFAELQASVRYLNGAVEGVPISPIPAAIFVTNSQNTTLGRVSVQHTGGSGFYVSGRSTNTLLLGCLAWDCSSSGFVAGPADFSAAAVSPLNTTLWSCASLTNAVEFHGSAGILVFYAGGTDIRKCLVRELPWSGISVSWGWCPFSSAVNSGILVRSNEVSRAVLLMSDAAFLYSNSGRIGGLDTYNWLHDSPGATNGLSFATYYDEGSSGVTSFGGVANGISALYYSYNGNNYGGVSLAMTVANNITSNFAANGPCFNSTNTYSFTVVSTAAAQAAGAALNTGLEAQYQNIIP
jgi:hypothetical protein